MVRKLLLFIFLVEIIPGHIHAQDCLEYFKQCSSYTGKTYEYDTNTRSLLLKKDDTIAFSFDVVNGIYYNIELCHDAFSLPLHFQLLDFDNIVLFDNKDENYTQTFDFSVDQSKQLKIEVNIDSECVNNITSCEGCVAVLIKKSIKERTGF